MEIGGEDFGIDPETHVGAPAGFVDNFSLTELVIGEDARQVLVAQFRSLVVLLLIAVATVALLLGDQGRLGEAEALYVDTLVFTDGLGLLNVDGLHLYYRALLGDESQIVNVPAVIPLPPAPWLLASALVGLGLVGRRRVTA